jgi:AAHS family 4-hydroxybenzoate transporter-like MFS transporter
MGWGFGPVIAILAIPATIAALAIVFTRFAARATVAA